MKKTVFSRFKLFLLDFWLPTLLVLVTIAFVAYLPTKRHLERHFDKEIFETKNFEGFEKYAQKNGAQNAYQILKDYFKNNESDAHDFAHVVGLVAYQKQDTEGLAICDTAYNYGCTHGFIEGFLLEKGIEKVGEIEKSCLSLGNLHAPSCLHGTGHGLMMNASYQLQTALKNCERLMESSQPYCWDGVFMERIIGAMQEPGNRPIITADTLDEPCKSQEPKYQDLCWRNQVTAWTQFYQGNSTKVLQKCTDLELKYQQTCFESVGLGNVMQHQENIEGLISFCQVAENFLIDSCLIGEIKELLFEGKNPQSAQQLCFYTSEQNKQSCYFLFNQLFAEYQSRFQKN